MFFIFLVIGIGLGVFLGWFLWARPQSLPMLGADDSSVMIDSDTILQVESQENSKDIIALKEERNFLESQFDLLLSKLDDEAKTIWIDCELNSLGHTAPLRAEKQRLAAKIKEFVSKVDKTTRRQVSSLEEESLGVISPIQEQLEAEAKARQEVQDSFEKLVSKLGPDLKNEWEGLDEGSIGLADIPEIDNSEYKTKYHKLLSKLAPELKEDWESLEDKTLFPHEVIISEDIVSAEMEIQEDAVEAPILTTEEWSRPAVNSPIEDTPEEKSNNFKPSWLVDAPEDEPDDLKKIWGIGPVLEKTLNGIGIYYFHQLQELKTDADIEWVSLHIKTFPDRIKRDQWVEQATKLIEDPTAVMIKPKR